MAIIKALRGKSPKIGKECFIAETAIIIGDVEIGNNCSLWFNSVIRGDVNYIKIGDNVNIQDNATIHCTYQKSPTNIGNNVSIAHNAVVHGATIYDNVLIGIGAIILDDAIIYNNTIIAPGAVVTKGTIVESGSIYAGIPAKKIKSLSPELLKGEVHRIANSYAMYASWYKSEDET
ncbi:MAG: gamma carbonic anhydrase family protein [Bacteroidetes bacterium CG2_30_33_31]|nr:MAG: gamma carbonic anhydrase family protein [Bacteroidetes bacterium CG2_30_33_31]